MYSPRSPHVWFPSSRARDVVLRQLCQRSTVVALLNAVVLLGGWHVAPEKIDSLGLLLSFLDTVILALVNEDPRRPGLPPGPGQMLSDGPAECAAEQQDNGQ